MPESLDKPFAQSYWVEPRVLCAGHYPGALDAAEQTRKLTGLLRCGIRRVINLIPAHETGAGGRPFVPYESELAQLAATQGTEIECLRMGFRDASAPSVEQMRAIVDVIDASVAAGEPVFIHCWGGHGRTGTTAACYLIRHGASPETAVARILGWRKTLPRNHFPFEGNQEDFVRNWPPGA